MNTEYVDTFKIHPVSQAELNEVIRKHVMFLTARSGGARAVLRDRDLSGLSFVGQNLSQSDFTGCIMALADCSHANFESATLFGCDLSKANLTNTRLVRADMRGAEINSACLAMADMTGADLRPGRMLLMRKVKSEKDMYADTAMGGAVQFLQCDMTGVNLSQATATNADFSDCILENAKMQGINLKGAVLKRAVMSHANLSGADLRQADFTQVLMPGVVLDDAQSEGTIFTDAITSAAKGTDVLEMPLTLDELTLMHVHWVATAGRQGKQMILENVDMRKAPELSGQRFTSFRAHKCTFASMDLRSIELQGANMDESDFRLCQMQSADLRGARLNNCLMQRANLSRADMTPLVLKKPDGAKYHIPCRLEGAILRNAVFTGARMNEARLNNCDLSNTDFTDCDLRLADFTGAKIEGAIFSHALLDGAIFDEGKTPGVTI